MATPNVLVRTHYYEVGSNKRDFYASKLKDDYVGYIDKGIKSTRCLDYLDYAGNQEKSSGLFSSDVLLSDEEKKDIRKRLRETDSCVWDMVISFEEGYGKKNVYDYRKAQDLLRKTLPGYLKSIGLEPENVTWFAGLHTNTDNRHIHLSFFENVPSVYDRKTHSFRYRKGKVSMEKVNQFKMRIESYFLEPIQGIERVRKKVMEKTKEQVTGLLKEVIVESKRLLRDLYEEIPKEGRLGYESREMKPYRGKIDAVIDLVLENENLGNSYRKLKEEMRERDRKIRTICKNQKNADLEPYIYTSKFEKDLRRRMGNLIIREIVSARNREAVKATELTHPKAIQRNHILSLMNFLSYNMAMSAKLSKEAWDCFTQAMEDLKKAEFERLLSEGEITLDV